MGHDGIISGGAKLGKFVIDQALGSGRRGRTFLGTHAFLRYPIVVKLLTEESELERQRELSLLRELAGDCAPELLDAGTTSGEQGSRPYLVMEYLAGETLRRVLQTHRRLDAQRVVQLGMQLLSAVEKVHELNYSHCDIKPDNVMVRGELNATDRIALLDFGAVQPLDDSDSGAPPATAIQGTPPYVAPEVHRGIARPSVVSDVYSVAAVLFECASGRRCPPGDTGKTAPPLHHLVPIDRALSRLIARGLHPDPEARFESARDFRQALEDLDIEDVVEVGADGTMAGTSQETLDTVRLREREASTSPGPRRSSPWFRDAGILLSTDRPVVWVLRGDPGIDRSEVERAFESLASECEVCLLSEEEREQKRVEFMYGSQPPSVLVFGDLHVLLGEPLLEELSKQGETSCFLISTHENAELLHNTLNACSLHGQACLPLEPESIAREVLRMVERSSSVRRHYDGLRLALRDAQEDLQTLQDALDLNPA